MELPYSSCPPIMRAPFLYCGKDVAMKPIPPAKPAQGLMGIRRERGKVIRPVTAPPAHPQKPNFYPIELPCRTCQTPDKLFPSMRPSLEFPVPSPRSGTDWCKATREQFAKEIGTSPRSCVRAFRSPRTPHVIYQIPSLYKTEVVGTGAKLLASSYTSPR